jgi:hypothetical protein
VPERDAGIASGPSNTAFRLGGALGVAIVSTVAVARSKDYLAANEGANPLVVLTEGFQSAYVACVVAAAIGMALALLLIGPAVAGTARGARAGGGDRRRGMKPLRLLGMVSPASAARCSTSASRSCPVAASGRARRRALPATADGHRCAFAVAMAFAVLAAVVASLL